MKVGAVESLVLATGREEPTHVRVGDVSVGRDFALIAGPCSVDDADVLMDIARAVKAAGAQILRGGAYKPRTSPYSFQGLGEEGLKILDEQRRVVGLPVVTEVLDTRDVELVAAHADALQIGARNMQNYALLKEVGKTRVPVVIKRGMSATYAEWLSSVEYVLHAGNPNVILCERGIRTFETHTRNTLDIAAVPVLKELSHLPVIVDPTHGTGRPTLIEPMSLAATAAGADGLMIEVHSNPDVALSDKHQALTPEEFLSIANRVRSLVEWRNDACAN